MPAEILIKSIVPSKPLIRRVRTGDGTEIQQWFDLEVRIENTSKKVQYVVSSLWGLDYDSATRTLKLHLKAPEARLELEGWDVTLKRPNTLAVQPGQDAVFTLHVPRIIKQLQFSSTGKISTTEIDIIALNNVGIVVAYSDTPLPWSNEESGRQALSRLASWGKSAESTISTSLSQDSSGPS